MADKVLEVRNLHFSYGEIKALRGISFEVKKGEIVALLGGNGAGKTTTLQAISNLIKGTTDGEIVLNGRNIRYLSPHNIAKLGFCLLYTSRCV